MKTRAERCWDTLAALAAVDQADNPRHILAYWWEYDARALHRTDEPEWWESWRLHELVERDDLSPRHIVYRISQDSRGELFFPPGREVRCRGFKITEET